MKRPVAAGAAVALALALGPITGVATTQAAAATVPLPTYATIVDATKLATEYYRTTYAHTTLVPKNGWSWSTYTVGHVVLAIGASALMVFGLYSTIHNQLTS